MAHMLDFLGPPEASKHCLPWLLGITAVKDAIMGSSLIMTLTLSA